MPALVASPTEVELRRRFDLMGGPGERADALGEGGHLPPAPRATSDVPADLHVHRLVQRAEQVVDELLADLVTAHVAPPALRGASAAPS